VGRRRRAQSPAPDASKNLTPLEEEAAGSDVFVRDKCKRRFHPKGGTVKFTKSTRLVIAVTAAIAGTSATALPAYAAHRHHHKRHHHSHMTIPQHNGGDRDVDNNGGPSDGDGNV
jgi:hypothetical protein